MRSLAVAALALGCSGGGAAPPAAPAPRPPARPLAERLTVHELDVAPAKVGNDQYLAGIALVAAGDGGATVVAWGDGADLHLLPLDATLARSGPDVVRPGEVPVAILGLPDGGYLLAVVPFRDGLFNAFRTDLPLDLIRLDPELGEAWRARIVGGQGTGAGATWHAYSAVRGAALASEGTRHAAFVKISKNFGTAEAPDTHQGDLFVTLDDAGTIDPASTEVWSASHSNQQHLALGPAGEPLTLTVGDAYPFGFYYIDRDRDVARVVWPAEKDPSIEAESTLSAGYLCGFARLGDRLYATAATSPRLPLAWDTADLDVLLTTWGLDGGDVRHTWLTDTPAPEVCPSVIADDDHLVAVWSARDDAEHVTIAELDADGAVRAGPERLAAPHHEHAVPIPHADGAVVWAVADYRTSRIRVVRLAR